MLSDSFPSYAQIMKGRTNRSFEMRQSWERKARAKFSRTIRRHMRDATTYSPSKVWTAEQSTLADLLLNDFATHADRDIDEHPSLFHEQYSHHEMDTIVEVWNKLQVFPHCFEIAERRNALHTLHLDGTLRRGTFISKTFTELHHNSWKIDVASLENFCSLGILSPALLEFFAQSLRLRLATDSTCFLRHDHLKHRKLSLRMRIHDRQREQALPARTFIPYLSESKFWALFV